METIFHSFECILVQFRYMVACVTVQQWHVAGSTFKGGAKVFQKEPIRRSDQEPQMDPNVQTYLSNVAHAITCNDPTDSQMQKPSSASRPLIGSRE